MSKIFGIGTDIVYVPRVEKIWQAYGDHFAKKILSPNELAHFKALPPLFPAKFLAKRFAVKEAAVKALGTGFRGGICLPDIEVIHDELGKPGLRFLGKVEDILQQYQIRDTQLTTSDEKEYVVAFVVMVTAAP
jgi:holo-[acyl-carrier protein] synthase